MSRAREAALKRLDAEIFDLAVIGGGITGAGIARDAALRRLKVALLEQRDFGFGTSSRSSKLIHGGLRYLQHAQLKLVFEGTNERALLVRLAPHLVRPVPFLIPTYRGQFPTLTMMDAGLWIYDALAKFQMPRHRRHDAAAVAALEPALLRERLSGGIVYFDAVTDDARLTLENVLDARDLGACTVNYARVTGVRRRAGRVIGLEVADRLGGRPLEVRARVTVNATGPWSDLVLEELAASPGGPRLRPTKGAHVLVDRARLPVDHAIVMTTADRRTAFTIPWDRRTVIGTTDTDYEGDFDHVAADAADVDYLLATANRYFPGVHLTRDDVLATWAGLRPLIAAEAVKASDVSREHEVFHDPGGIITINGGKLTTYRRMAREVVDAAVESLHHRGFAEDALPCTTESRPLRGALGLGESVTPGAVAARLQAQTRLDPEVSRHLALTYGAHAIDFVPRLERDPALGERIDPELPYIWAQLDHAVEEELAMTVEDFLGRRAPLLLMARDQGLGAAPEVARRMASLLDWDAAARAAALRHYETVVAESRAFRG